jgi:hypothetical protein
MDTLRGFVDSVWTSDQSVKHEHATAGVWSKPDTISGSFELRRLTTSKSRSGVQTDFFEFYWAHLMEGTMVSHVLAWVRCLLIRWPWKVPKQLRGAWLLLLLLTLVILFFALQTVLPEEWRVIDVPKWMTGAAGLIVAWIAVPIIKNIIGDAARYLNPAPGNIKRRQEIRAKGVKLLEKLHKHGYRRIIVVGHSLGSVIGYDILTHAWALYNNRGDASRGHPIMTGLEKMVAEAEYTVDDYRSCQTEMLNEMVQNGYNWRVTDFITLGSPLAHASILLAADREDLRHKQNSREFPTCPPELENGNFSYPPDRSQRTPHHAAVFAPTRWTNLYFPSRLVFQGDLIGGPLSPVFGRGIRDVKVSTSLRWGLASHTLYWTPGKGNDTATHITLLREALALADPVPPKGEKTDEANQ